MTTQHTQGLLRVPDDGTVGSIETEDGTPIGHTFQVSAHDQGIGSPIRRANARRLVACWNACEGISTENLEENQPIKELATNYNTVIRQRDQLLKALESVWLWMENQADGQSKGGHATFDLLMLREQRDIARAAIDKATLPAVQNLPADDTKGGAL
jgi:hypothetical protein